MTSARKESGGGRQRATPKVQRWTDLIASLLRHTFPIPFDQIAREVPGYATGAQPESVKRTFERDKKELLRFGVPIETRLDEDGEPTLYTIRKKGFYLPYLALLTPERPASAPRHGRVALYGYQSLATLAFEPDELAVVADAAARVRQLGDASLASEAESAMRKLAYDLPVGATAPGADAPRVVGPKARPGAGVLEALDAALRDRKAVTFDYRAMESGQEARRTVEPYGLFYLHGHWYLAACDRDRQALRNFRLSRIANVARVSTREATPDYEIPSAFRLREHARSRQAWELGDGDATEAVVEFVRGTGAALAAARLGEALPADADRDSVEFPARRAFRVRRLDAFARWLLSFAGDARPVAPQSLVDMYADQIARTRALYERGAT